MLSVILVWCYMAVTMFAVGYGIMTPLSVKFGYKIKHKDAYLLCGLVSVTVYAQFFSLFYKIGLAANLVLCVVCAFLIFKYRGAFLAELAKIRTGLVQKDPGKRGRIAAWLFLFLLFAYGTSRGIIHYDTGLYHAQSIRWLEEYGLVKGLGNLHCRLAYNSSSFALSALYSMAFLGGQSYHCAAGFLAFVLAKVCMEVTGAIRRRRMRVSDFARIMGIYYLVIIFDEMVSPASDYFMVLTAFYIVIRWLDLLQEQEKNMFPYAQLCVLCVFLITVKLSAALILLLVIYPAYFLIKEKRGKETALYLGLGMVTALPYFIRNILISGWLVYPFTRIDLFDVAWKIPKGLADYDAKEIQVWGRGYTDVGQYDIGIGQWFPGWFRSLAGSDKLFVLLSFGAVLALIVYAAGMACRLWHGRWDVLLVQGTVAASFLFWLCSSPLIRYGCVYVYLTPAVVLGGIYDTVMYGVDEGGEKSGAGAGRNAEAVRRAAASLVTAAAVLLLCYKAAALGREMVVSFTNDYWIMQKDYENYEVRPYEVNGMTFYYPAEGDRVGYEAFPSSPAKAEIGFLGEGIEDGFYAAQ